MRRLKREEGVVLVLVALLAVVLFAMAGLAVDLGALYSERRELRTGADAAALAVAENCGRGTGPCSYSAAEATAAEYAGWNSSDGASRAQVSLDKAPDGTGWVRVVTSAFDEEAGVAGVRVPFMSVLGIERIDVTATATAMFDHPASVFDALPLIVDACEFYKVGGGPAQNLYHPEPLYEKTACTAPGSTVEWDSPNDFGWLAGSSCARALTAYAWQAAQTGGAPQCITQSLRPGADVLIPLSSDVDADGGAYRIVGFAFFHVTAYDIELAGGGTHEGTGSGYPPCSPVAGGSCLQGYFLHGPVYEGEPGGRDFGAVLVKLID